MQTCKYDQMGIILRLLVIVSVLAACTPSQDSEPPLLTEIENPAAKGGRYPYVTQATGKILMSWLEPTPDAAEEQMNLMWAAYDGANWSDPELIHSGQGYFVNWADFPSLAGLDETPIVAHWLQKLPGGTYAYHVNMAFRSESGGWSQPITPHQDLSATEHGFVSMIPVDEERIFAIWLDGYKTRSAGHDESMHQPGESVSDLSTAMTLRSAMINRDGSQGRELEVDGSVCDCCQTSVAHSGNRIIAVYRNRTAGEIRDHYRAIYDLESGEWSEPLALSREGWEIAGCPVNGPQVAAFGETVIATWFSAVNDQPRAYLAVSHDGGLNFEEAELLNENGSMGRVGIAFNRSGTALLTWLGSDPDNAVIYGQMWKDSALGNPFVIGEINPTRASGFPRSAAVGNEFLVAWTEPDHGSHIKTVLISPKAESTAGK
jgi:hypothetical protein